MLNIVKQAMEAVQASKLELSQLKKALRQHLTMEQFQLVFVELIKNQDFHSVLKQLDARKFETKSTRIKVQHLVVQLIKTPDCVALATRAAIATAGACVFSNVVMFGIFAAFELIQLSRGHRTLLEFGKNMGEHATGLVSGTFGASAGLSVGVAVGTLFAPGIGTAIGGIIGSLIGGVVLDFFGRAIYRKIVPSNKTKIVEEYVTVEQELTKQELVEKAAEKFKIDINNATFEEAQTRFRRLLLANHPDKHPDVSEEEQKRLTAETADILACWYIVREYYKERGDVTDIDCDEGFIKICAYQILDFATKKWRTVRTYLPDLNFRREIDPTKEKIQELTIYV